MRFSNEDPLARLFVILSGLLYAPATQYLTSEADMEFEQALQHARAGGEKCILTVCEMCGPGGPGGGCGIGVDACAFGVPQFGENGIVQKCDQCRDQQPGHDSPPSVDTCPGHAVIYRGQSCRQKGL